MKQDDDDDDDDVGVDAVLIESIITGATLGDLHGSWMWGHSVVTSSASGTAEELLNMTSEEMATSSSSLGAESTNFV